MDKFFFSILLILLVSCSSTTPADRVLDTAETIMDQHPDSALSILNRIDPSELVSDKSRALYSLLITQALDKNYIDSTPTLQSIPPSAILKRLLTKDI